MVLVTLGAVSVIVVKGFNSLRSVLLVGEVICKGQKKLGGDLEDFKLMIAVI